MEYVDFVIRFPMPDNPTDEDILEAKARVVTAVVMVGAPEGVQVGLIEDELDFSEDIGKLH